MKLKNTTDCYNWKSIFDSQSLNVVAFIHPSLSLFFNYYFAVWDQMWKVNGYKPWVAN